MTLEPHKDITTIGRVHYYHRLQQGCQEWHDLRRGMLTASIMNNLITPSTLKIAGNKDTRTAIYELAALRLTDTPVDNFTNYAMERGKIEEIEAKEIYSKHIEPVYECGFITNDSLGFHIGYSPDGLVGNDGLIEVKSRAQKYQMQTIIEHIFKQDDANLIPREYMLQIQTGLWVTGRKWCDFISYSNGMNMAVIRVEPIPVYQDKIAEAAEVTEKQVQKCIEEYRAAIIKPSSLIIPVEWVDHHEEIIA